MSTAIDNSALQHGEHAVRPILFNLAKGVDRGIVSALIDDPDIYVFDTLEAQLGELAQTRHPKRRLTDAERIAAVKELLGDRPVERGTWVFYPWCNCLVHVLPEAEFIELRTSRNRYLITAEEQAELADKRVGIVGLSVGQSVAFAIALERGCGELRLADFDTLELSNMNRIRASLCDLGLPKVVIAARAIAEQDPYLKVRTFPDGLTLANEEAFFTDGGQLDLVVDECDGLDMKVRLRQTARDLGIPVVMQTSDRGMLDIERFDLEPERPFFHGLAGDLRAADLVGLSNEEKVPPLLKMIGATTLSTRATASLLEVERSIRTWPQLGSAVMLGGGIAADAVRRVLLNELRQSRRFYVDIGELVSDTAQGARPRVDATLSREFPLPPGEGQGEGAQPNAATAPEVIRRLISRAILAPSGGNRQPWRWTVRGNLLELRDDPARRTDLADFDHHGTTVALGAAAENIVLAAHAEGLEVRTEVRIEGASVVATFELCAARPNEGHDWDHLAEQIERRHTDRRQGDFASLPPEQVEALERAARSMPGVDLRLFSERADIVPLANLIGEGDRLRMLDPGLRHEMFTELRWSKEEVEASADGLDVDSMALSAIDRTGLELCRRDDALEVLSRERLGTGLGRLGEKWALASSALGLLLVEPADRMGYFNAGRALQRMWLEATRLGLALHPMTFLPYALARVKQANGAGFAPATVEALRRLVPEYQRRWVLGGGEGEVLLFRLHPSKGMPAASARRSVEAVLRVE